MPPVAALTIVTAATSKSRSTPPTSLHQKPKSKRTSPGTRGPGSGASGPGRVRGDGRTRRRATAPAASATDQVQVTSRSADRATARAATTGPRRQRYDDISSCARPSISDIAFQTVVCCSKRSQTAIGVSATYTSLPVTAHSTRQPASHRTTLPSMNRCHSEKIAGSSGSSGSSERLNWSWRSRPKPLSGTSPIITTFAVATRPNSCGSSPRASRTMTTSCSTAATIRLVKDQPTCRRNPRTGQCSGSPGSRS